MTGASALAIQLRSCRQSAGLSQEELAERSGLSIRAISNLERGRTRRPHPESVQRLADALGLQGVARADFLAAAGRGRPLPTAIATSSERPVGWPVIPRQLPPPIGQFAGRQRELAELTSLLDRTDSGMPKALVISAIGGTAGVGKTALAVQWAHRVAEWFPDGQLYVNLRGFDPSGKLMSPAAAIRCFLDGLKVPAEQIPASLEAQAALYRSLVSGRRMLVLLDNARDAEQVRPLLPGGPGCLVVVTSRSQLTGLIAADGARPQSLDVLTRAEAQDMLTQRLGAERIAAEPDAATELIGLCARLPLALAIAAARAAAYPRFPLATLAIELADARSRLDALTTGENATDVRAVFSWSYLNLPAPAARMFRLLSLHPGPDITAPAAASLAGLDLSQAHRLLRELTRGRLLNEHSPGRYAFHDLLRSYAAELAQAADDAERGGAAAAAERMLDHYLHTAQAAALMLDPTGAPIIVTPAAPGCTPECITNYSQAMGWCGTEHRVLIALIDFALASGQYMHACQISWALEAYFDFQGHWHDLAVTQRAALAAAVRLGDPATQARARATLGGCCIRLGRLPEARDHLQRAAYSYRRANDPGSEALCRYHLARALGEQRRFRDALRQGRLALELFESVGQPSGQAKGLNAVGWFLTQLGDYAQAVTCCQQALQLNREFGDRYGQAAVLDSLGYAHHHLRQHAKAIEFYQDSLSLCRELGDRYGQADVLTHLGDTRHAVMQPQQARDAWQEALAILNDLDHPEAGKVRAKLSQLDVSMAVTAPQAGKPPPPAMSSPAGHDPGPKG